MHDAAFAQAAAPAPVRLLKLELRPYSIGHELLLRSKAESPDSDSRKILELMWAVLICSHSWEEYFRLRKQWLMGLKVWLWGRRIRNEDFNRAALELAAYRRAGSTWPPNKTPNDREASRVPGSPFLLRLHRFVMRELGKSEAEAWDYPLGLAQWHWCSYWEDEGRLEVLNAAESEFELDCAAEDARRERLGLRVEIAPDVFRRPPGVGGPLRVEVGPEEEVVWTWSHNQEVGPWVSGYTLRRKGTHA